MRITYRTENNLLYWRNRWKDLVADEPCANPDVYPLKYAAMVVREGDRILEAGCGMGRILRYYHDKGFAIEGVDFVQEAIDTLGSADPSLNLAVGDITQLKYPDDMFDTVLAFGLYHNLPIDKWQQALCETRRVMRQNGQICASVRADNWANRITDCIKSRQGRASVASSKKLFHKINLSDREVRKIFSECGFRIESVYHVINMPILYKARCFRCRDHKEFDESRARRDGYLLNWAGRLLQRMFMWLLPHQYCNVYVIQARKVG